MSNQSNVQATALIDPSVIPAQANDPNTTDNSQAAAVYSHSSFPGKEMQESTHATSKNGCKIHNLYHALDYNLQWEDKDYSPTILAKSTTVDYCFLFFVLSA